jgi:hypothetical protein
MGDQDGQGSELIAGVGGAPMAIASDHERDFAPIPRQHLVARFFRAAASGGVGLTARIRDERFRLKTDHQAQRARFMMRD